MTSFVLIDRTSNQNQQNLGKPAQLSNHTGSIPGNIPDVLHPESKQQTTPAAPRDALECVAALARTREDRQNCVRFAYLGPQVDRLHVLELKRDVE